MTISIVLTHSFPAVAVVEAALALALLVDQTPPAEPGLQVDQTPLVVRPLLVQSRARTTLLYLVCHITPW